ncbi:lysophospholipid acyltransferase family protein [soil metagenome]|jgi:1-acyl-sn-glycerol-3-phosphate acyltransferase
MWFYYLSCFVFRNFLRLFYGLEVYGRDRVPLTGGAVIAGNHISAFDPPLVGSVLPREVDYMAKKELFERQPVRWVVERLKAFPVDREKGDTSAIKEALRRLRADTAVGIFPEGTRYAEAGQAFHGAAFLAQRARAPLIPTAIWREGRAYRVAFGEPIYPEGKSREEMVALTRALMARVQALIPPEAQRSESAQSG